MHTRWPPWLCVAFRFGVSFFAITTLYLAIGHAGSLIPYATPIAEVIQYRGLFAAYRWGVERLFGPEVSYPTIHGFIAYLSTALVGAGATALVWSLIDRRRSSYPRAHAVLRVYLRYLLAAVALSYGAIKVIPSQFAPPSLVELLTPLGEFTRMRLLWHSMGTSTAYVVFSGLVEVAGGLLLLSRRGTPLGALLLAAAFANVTVLNFGYDVGVQLNSTIYTLMALTLLAPDARRLAAAFLSDRPIPEESGRAARWIRPVKALVIVLLIVVNVRYAYRSRSAVVARPMLYGIYEVEGFERDGMNVPLSEGTGWQRVVIAERGGAAIQTAPTGRLDLYDVTDDPGRSVLTFTSRGDRTPVLTLQYERQPDGTVAVVGRLQDHQVRARLRAINVTKFPLRRPRR